MKSKSTAILLILLAAITMYISCQKEPILSEEVPIDLLIKAKEWHQMHSKVNKLSTGNNKTDQNNKNLTPIWDKAVMSQLSTDERIVVVPMKEYKISSTEVDYIRNYVYISSKNKITEGYIIEIFGAVDFIDDNVDFLISKHRDKSIENFTGSILKYDIDYRYLNSAVYRNGVLIQGNTKIQNGANTSVDKKRGALPVVQSESNCTAWYLVTTYYDGDGNMIDQTTQYLYTTCTDTGGGGGGPGGSPGVDCNGDYGGSATMAHCGCIGGNTGVPACPTIPRSYCTGLTSTEQATIDATVEAYRTLNCVAKYIFNRFKNNNYEVKFCIDENLSKNAAYNPSTNTVTFKTDYTASRVDVLEHELFHAFQDDWFGGTQVYAAGDPGYVNIEFEQIVMRDILNNDPTAFYLFPGASITLINLYESWIDGLSGSGLQYPENMVPGTTAYNNFKIQYFSFLNQFNAIPNNPYSSFVLTALEPTALSWVFSQTTKNCTL